MFAWICSFASEFEWQALCPAISIQRPLFCTKLVGAGFAEMIDHGKFSSQFRHPRHFIHGLICVEKGFPYNDPLTQWQQAAFTQHELFGTVCDVYSIKVTVCHRFVSQVHACTHRVRAGEAQVQARANCVFYT